MSGFAGNTRKRAPNQPALLSESFLVRRYLVEERSTESIAREAGVCAARVRKRLVACGIGVRQPTQHLRRYIPPQVTGFIAPDSDWHAYWLGFLAAGGCVWNSNRVHLLRVKLQASDAEHLLRLRAGLRVDSPLKFVQNRSAVMLEVGGREIVSVLTRWGIVQNKTRCLQFAHEMRPSFLWAYVRGYFDGDGILLWRPWPRSECVCRFTSGSPEFLDDLQDFLESHEVELNKRYRNGNSHAYVLPLSGRKANLQRFAQLLYNNAETWLSRKREEFYPLAKIAELPPLNQLDNDYLIG